MSRHNLRAPLANNGDAGTSTPKSWLEWDVPGGQLTTKGGVLEVYMGHICANGWRSRAGHPAASVRRRIAFTPTPTVCNVPWRPRSSFITGAFPAMGLRFITSRKWAPWTRRLIR